MLSKKHAWDLSNRIFSTNQQEVIKDVVWQAAVKRKDQIDKFWKGLKDLAANCVVDDDDDNDVVCDNKKLDEN